MGDKQHVVSRSDTSYGQNLRLRAGAQSPHGELILPAVEHQMSGLKLTHSTSAQNPHHSTYRSQVQRTPSAGSLGSSSSKGHKRSQSRDSVDGIALGGTSRSGSPTIGGEEHTSKGTRKVKLLCSINGELSQDGALLNYTGGETRIVSLSRGMPLSDLLQKLDVPPPLAGAGDYSLKYVLPGEDSILVSVCSNDELENMFDEFDEYVANGGPPTFKMRAFVVPGTGGSGGDGAARGGGSYVNQLSPNQGGGGGAASVSGGGLPGGRRRSQEGDSGDGSRASSTDNLEASAVGGSNTATAVNRLTGLELIPITDLEKVKTLGEGSFGVVEQARWGGADVAVKWLRMSLFAVQEGDEEGTRRVAEFYREAQILGTLRHPNVVTVYGVIKSQVEGCVEGGVGGGNACHGPGIVTEFMPEGSLSRQLKGTKLDARRKISLALDAARGMAYLHSKKIVHFDLKTDNLLVGRMNKRMVCKVCDFGLSRQRQQTYVSELSWRHGTLAYTAPEVLKSPHRVGEKADVFSFGIVLWEMWSARRPYGDVAEPALLAGLMFQNLRPDIPQDVEPPAPGWRELMLECWNEEPDERPSFEVVCDVLEKMGGDLAAATAAVAAE